jgi:hypothetical protein
MNTKSISAALQASALFAFFCAPVFGQVAPRASDSPNGRGLEARHSGQETIIQLSQVPPTDVSLPCLANKTIKIIRKDAAQPPSAAKANQRPLPSDEQVTLIMSAQLGAGKLVLADARCDASGALVTSGVTLEPQPSAPTSPCLLPHAKEAFAACR